jgi:small multidrug resistance pump
LPALDLNGDEAASAKRPEKPERMTRVPALVVALAALLAAAPASGVAARAPARRSAIGRRPAAAPLLRLRGGAAAAGAAAGPLGAWAALPPKTRGWLILAAATCFELSSSILLKIGQGFTYPVQSTLGCALYAASFAAFNASILYLEISVAYAVWSAVVIAALAAAGGLFFGESMSTLKIAGVVVTIAGTAMLSLSDASA